MNKIKVLVADDQSILAEGLCTLLNMEEDIQVEGIAQNGIEVLKFLEDGHDVDIILMDIRMPLMNGVDCTRKVTKTYPKVKVLILTTFDDDDYIIDALNNGAVGYMLKDLTAEKLSSAIRNVYQGNTVMHQKITQKIIQGMGNGREGKTVKTITDSGGNVLLEREVDVLRLLAKGYRNKEIADTLYLTEGTVKNYISLLYDKFNIKGRTKLMTYAIKHGILENEDQD
ncbi:Uncharacterized transcriptional regulatory protein YfiK [Petrocella atlantisensis]|uniref:Stage 0 sporulation protein A homolog n=1 Tax=Petrocella atlantisensis TaxID=2173034 RepID=A0A3P7PXW8_9FIRM|nr:response regulator transcription factor [Petrocella atlantisensis]MCF8020555.1 response regulator transcription factor [Vallitaleaceae bacterium]VDN48021.1 Uncharacterized transcriptional regulatory protein YfiK [Petrocella atlantisensis]